MTRSICWAFTSRLRSGAVSGWEDRCLDPIDVGVRAVLLGLAVVELPEEVLIGVGLREGTLLHVSYTNISCIFKGILEYHLFYMDKG